MAEQQGYQVTARKWRPSEFASVVGQEHVTQTLRNAIRQERVHHAYLFTGPRGVGKTTTARILAKALNCLNPGEDFEPCNQCESCVQISEGRSLDVVEIDGASNNSVEDVRKLRDNARFPPIVGKKKLYIIDEVHMLSTSAFNALLKTLEEPPAHLIFVFATTEPHKVPATILSRCQRFDFRRMQIEDIVGRLQYIAGREGYTVEEDALVTIARKADGSMRDAQSIFDQVISFCGVHVTLAGVHDALNIIDAGFFFRVTDMMRSGAPAEAFAIVEEVTRTGFDPGEFLVGLAEHLRNMLAARATGSTRLIEAAKVYVDRYAADAPTFEEGDLIRALHLVLAAGSALRSAVQPRLRLELVLVQLAAMESTVQLSRLIERLDNAGGALPAAAGTTPAAVPAVRPAVARPVQSSPASMLPAEGGEVTSAAAPETPQSANVAETSPQSVAEVSNTPYSPLGALRTRTGADLALFPTAPPPRPVTASAVVYAPMADATIVAEAPMPMTHHQPSLLAPPPHGGDDASAVGAHAMPGVAATTLSGPTIDTVKNAWGALLDRLEEEKQMQMVTALRQATPGELAGRHLRLFVPGEYQGIVERKAKLLCERLGEMIGSGIGLEVVAGTPPPVLNDAGESPVPPNATHPFVASLIELLGAVAI